MKIAVLFLAAACIPRTIAPDPTPDAPKVACIASSPFPAFQGKHKISGSRLLPEMVRVIGVTSGEDGERWKVLRQGETNPDNWLPYAKSEIQFGGACGPEAGAYEQVARASAEEQQP